MHKLLGAFVTCIVVSFTMSVGRVRTVFATDAGVTAGVDTVYVNGEVLTMNASNDIAQAVAVKGDKIHAVGRNSDIRALIGPNTRMVDLAGKTLLPGFIDAHGHFPESGVNVLYRVNTNSPPIGTTQSIADIIARLREKAQKTPKGQWIQGFGYDDTLLAEKRHPTRDDLDKVSTEHPIWLSHISGHFGVANSLALERAKITADTPDPKGGVIRRYPGTRKPNGVFEEMAWQHFDENRTGSIESGKLADLVILAESPLRFPLHIRDIQVLETIVGGQTIYKNW